MNVDMRVLELLSSKICHDLISPVSAIGNGVELIEDIGGSVVNEAMALIGDSAIQASRRLRMFRLAYGRAGSEEGFSVKDARTVAEQYLSGGKIAFSWPQTEPQSEISSHRGFLKVLLNLLIFSEEVLAYGGSVSVNSPKDEGRLACRLEIVGRNAKLSSETELVLAGKTLVEELTPRTIQAFMTGQYAINFGFELSYDQTITDRLAITVSTLTSSSTHVNLL